MAKVGHAYLKCVFSEAAVLFLRKNPHDRACLEKLDVPFYNRLTLGAPHFYPDPYFSQTFVQEMLVGPN